MNSSFGIDHPLIATHDINALREQMIALGFNMTAIGKHPWGTSTSLAMFEGCLLEVMGIYDKSLIDEIPAGDFRFGRHIYEHLKVREGIALMALHSTDSVTDAQQACDAGFHVAGHLEFGRDVTLPNGIQDRTKTTLALLPSKSTPRLSLFLCQQHRPELLYVPRWLDHPNTAYSIAGIWIAARRTEHTRLYDQFDKLYQNAISLGDGFQVTSATGPMRFQSPEAIEKQLGKLPKVINTNEPCIVGVDLYYKNQQALRGFLQSSPLNVTSQDDSLYIINDSTLLANTILRFIQQD
jgi:hypothetical protein